MNEELPNRTAKLFLRKLPRDIHSQFKAICARRNRTMTGMVVAFMRDVSSADENKVVNFTKLSVKYPSPK